LYPNYGELFIVLKTNILFRFDLIYETKKARLPITDMGILGIMTAVALPLIFWKIEIKTLKKYKNKDLNNYYLIIALFAAGSSIIVRNLFNSIGLLYVGGIQTDLPFWLIFGSLIYFYKMPLPVKEVMEDQIKSSVT